MFKPEQYDEEPDTSPSPKFNDGQLVRFNRREAFSYHVEGLVQLRAAPITIADPGITYVSAHSVGMVIYTELAQEELNGLKRCGYYPLVQEMIVVIMGDKMIYVPSKILLPI